MQNLNAGSRIDLFPVLGHENPEIEPGRIISKMSIFTKRCRPTRFTNRPRMAHPLQMLWQKTHNQLNHNLAIDRVTFSLRIASQFRIYDQIHPVLNVGPAVGSDLASADRTEENGADG